MHLPDKSPDRRVQRTSQVLLQALRELLTQQGYDTITVQTILDRANVSRATFYAHYESKDDLLRSSISGLGRLLARSPRAAGARLGFTPFLFEHLAGHRAVFLLSVQPGRDVTVERAFRAMLDGLVRDEITTRAVPTLEEALAVQHVVGALWSTMVWWMIDGEALSAAEVDARFRQLVLPGLDSLFQQSGR